MLFSRCKFFLLTWILIVFFPFLLINTKHPGREISPLLIENKSYGGGTVGKVLAMQSQGPEFNPWYLLIFKVRFDDVHLGKDGSLRFTPQPAEPSL